MKILYVNDFDVRGGAEIVVHQLASDMQRKGHETYFAFAETEGGDRCFKISRAKPGLMGEETVYSKLVDPIVFEDVKDAIERVRPDIIHLNNLVLVTLAPLMAAKEFEVPCIISVHDYWPVCPRRSLLKPDGQVCLEDNWAGCFHCAALSHPSRLVRLVGTRCSPLANKLFERKMKECSTALRDEVLICASRFVRDVLVRFGYSQRNSRVIPYGIGTHTFSASSNFTNTLLWVGRITTPKGLEYFVKAADVVAEKYPSTQFVVVGKDCTDSMYRYKKVPRSGAVKFVAGLPFERLPEYYSNSLALVITSVWPEPFGLVALEAMSCGKPVIAFETGGLKEIIADSETGFLVKPKDHLALVDKIIALLRDKQLATKMGRKARDLVETNYTADRMCASYEKIYAETVGY